MTILGMPAEPQLLNLYIGSIRADSIDVHYVHQILEITGLEEHTKSGAWESDVLLQVSELRS